MSGFRPTDPRTEEEWRLYMACEIDVDGERIKVANIGFGTLEDPTKWWYVPYGLDPMSESARLPYVAQGFNVSIDPRYWYTQNRELLFYREIYRGEPERWTLGWGSPPIERSVPYESEWEANR